MLQGALSLGSPQAVGRDFDLTKGVALYAGGCHVSSTQFQTMTEGRRSVFRPGADNDWLADQAALRCSSGAS